MDFKLWLERQFIQLPLDVETNIDHWVRNVLPLHQNLKKKQEGDFLGKIKINDEDIRIYAMDLPANQGGKYGNGLVYLNYRFLKNPKIIRQTLQHELTHAIDPVANFEYEPTEYDSNMSVGELAAKAMGRAGVEYIQGTKNLGPGYFNHPAEFNAYGSELAFTIKNAMAQMSIDQQTKTIIQLKNWLRSSKLPGKGGWLLSKLKMGSLPSVLNPYVFWKAQSAWKQDPKLWRKFRQKLYDLLDKLERQNSIDTTLSQPVKPPPSRLYAHS